MKYSDFTEAQKRTFSDSFYARADFDDRDSLAPWGCPWLWSYEDVPMRSIITLAQEHYRKHKEEILESLKEEAESEKEKENWNRHTCCGGHS